MTRFLVDIQLKVLVVVEKATSFFENCQMKRITLFQHVVVIAASYLSLHFDALSAHFRSAHGNGVTPAI